MAKTSKRVGSAPKRSQPALPELPGTTLTWLLLAGAMLWFAGRLWAMRSALAPAEAATGVDSQTVSALVIFALPTIISAALLVGASVGLAAMLWGRATARSGKVRLGTSAAAGLLAAVATGGALVVSGGSYPGSVVTAAVSVAVATLIGGMAAAARVPTVAAGLAGALGVALVQFVTALFTSPLRGLLDGDGTGPEVADAERRLAMIVGVVAGIVAGIVSHAVLRRMQPVGLAHHVAAGGAAGVFLLVAEAISRITLPLLVGAAGGRTGDDPLVLQLTGEARLNAGLLVLFAGAITAVLALGRSRRGTAPPATRRGTGRTRSKGGAGTADAGATDTAAISTRDPKGSTQSAGTSAAGKLDSSAGKKSPPGRTSTVKRGKPTAGS